MEKFQNKYRITSAQLQNWNFGSPGLYFVTVCTKNHEHYFGELRNGEMTLNELGHFAHAEREKSPAITSDMRLELGKYVVKSNHFHGILFIGENEFNMRVEMDGVGDVMHLISTPNKFGHQSKISDSIMRGFKSSVTTHSKKINIEFGWQSRYHDHIIRNHKEYIRISNYKINNPANWKDDKFFGEG